MKKFSKKYLIISALSIFVLAEAGLRLSGITDFPLYEANNKIGYIMKPSQAGTFIRKNEWQFNELSMGADKFLPSSSALDTLLVGDSIVLGGNPLSQPDRLGPQLEKTLGGKVWPISAGSWTVINELVYLNTHPEVVRKVDQIIFVFNSGDLVNEASSWSCETTHPRTKPLLASTYVFKKYIYNWEQCTNKIMPQYKVPDAVWQHELATFMQSPEVQGKQISFYLYPDVKEEKDSALWQSHFRQLSEELVALTHINAYDLSLDSRWSGDAYRDGIHTSAKGSKLLAEIMAKPEQQAYLRPAK